MRFDHSLSWNSRSCSLWRGCRKYVVGISNVSEWRKNRQQIERWNSVSPSLNRKTKYVKPSEYDKTDKALYLWFTQHRAPGILLSGPFLHKEAIEISENLHVIEAPSNFKASEG